MLPDQGLDSRDLSSVEPTRIFKPKRIQPKLCLIRVALNVNVRRLLPVAREKEEPLGSRPENGRSHLLRLCQFLEELASSPRRNLNSSSTSDASGAAPLADTADATPR